MKDEYLKDLEDLLEVNHIANKDEIIRKYRKRYEFALESDMSDEEIVSMLGTPEEVLMKYQSNESDDTIEDIKDDYKKDYNLVIRTVNDDISIVETDEYLDIVYDDIDLSMYNILNDDEKGIEIEYKKNKFFGLNRRTSGKITVKLPKNITFDKVIVSSTSGDISIMDIDSRRIEISSTSGDICVLDAKSKNEININVVSSDVMGNTLSSNRFAINTVSGDLKINKLTTEKIDINSLSGDIIIDKSTAKDIYVTSISGDILIDGKEYKSFAKAMGAKK